MMIRLLIATTIIASLASCGRRSELRPRLILQGEPVGNDFWLAAPSILVVKIIAANLQGSRQPIYQGGPKTLQLIKFDALVENVIKGDLPYNHKVSFYFFAKVDQNPTYYLEPGKRYIVSLRSEGGVLRSWADATQLKIEVHSGSHRQQDLPLERGPSVTIAYILLTPGADFDPETFANTLGLPPNSYGGPQYVNERLKQLQLSPNRTLRDSACIAAARIFWHRPKCLEQAVESPDQSIRQDAAKYLKDDNVNLPKRLQDDPFSLFPGPWTDYMFQMFEIYTEDMRPEVRKAACADLRSLAPQRTVSNCP
jgi:hypothetical protein